MLQASNHQTQRREEILAAAIPVFGRFGFQKTSVDDIAKAAKISKQGLYLHFSSKEEVFSAAMKKYLDDGLMLVQRAISRPKTDLFNRLKGAMDAWFGRHLDTFAPGSMDVIEAGGRLSGREIEAYKPAIMSAFAKAIRDSPEFNQDTNVCSPKEIAQILFRFGLTWKEARATRADFMKNVGLAIRACCQIEGRMGARNE